MVQSIKTIRFRENDCSRSRILFVLFSLLEPVYRYYCLEKNRADRLYTNPLKTDSNQVDDV